MLRSTTGSGTATVTSTATGLTQGTVEVVQTPTPPPVKIINSASPTSIMGDSVSTSLITANLCDASDTLITTATDQVTFTLGGTGTLLGITTKNASGA